MPQQSHSATAIWSALLPSNRTPEEADKCLPIFPFANRNQGTFRVLMPCQCETRKAKAFRGGPVAVAFPVLDGDVGAFDAQPIKPAGGTAGLSSSVDRQEDLP